MVLYKYLENDICIYWRNSYQKKCIFADIERSKKKIKISTAHFMEIIDFHKFPIYSLRKTNFQKGFQWIEYRLHKEYWLPRELLRMEETFNSLFICTFVNTDTVTILLDIPLM